MIVILTDRDRSHHAKPNAGEPTPYDFLPRLDLALMNKADVIVYWPPIGTRMAKSEYVFKNRAGTTGWRAREILLTELEAL